MEIIQIEKNGIVCVTIKGRTEAELTPEFAEVVKQSVEGDKRQLLIFYSLQHIEIISLGILFLCFLRLFAAISKIAIYNFLVICSF